MSLSGKTLVACKGAVAFPDDSQQMEGHIDVWWVFDLFPAKGLLLLIPFLLQQSATWSKTKLRLFAVATPDTNIEELQTLLAKVVGWFETFGTRDNGASSSRQERSALNHEESVTDARARAGRPRQGVCVVAPPLVRRGPCRARVSVRRIDLLRR